MTSRNTTNVIKFLRSASTTEMNDFRFNEGRHRKRFQHIHDQQKQQHRNQFDIDQFHALVTAYVSYKGTSEILAAHEMQHTDWPTSDRLHAYQLKHQQQNSGSFNQLVNGMTEHFCQLQHQLLDILLEKHKLEENTTTHTQQQPMVAMKEIPSELHDIKMTSSSPKSAVSTSTIHEYLSEDEGECYQVEQSGKPPAVTSGICITEDEQNKNAGEQINGEVFDLRSRVTTHTEQQLLQKQSTGLKDEVCFSDTSDFDEDCGSPHGHSVLI